jgi:lipopolysaccharide transport system ATP-binding protein
MSKREMDRKFDEMVDFAEAEKFIDTPFKHYSTGLQMRLAFAVAADLEPEILLVDEVLAVGDASFQNNCLGKMGDISRQGRTIFFVSHNNMIALRSLCIRALWLDGGGQSRRERPAMLSIIIYRRNTVANLESFWDSELTAPGNHLVRLRSARVIPEADSTSNYNSHTTTN